jgi:hypothetical protein
MLTMDDITLQEFENLKLRVEAIEARLEEIRVSQEAAAAIIRQEGLWGLMRRINDGRKREA